LLVTIAKRLRAVCRSSDTVARVSGDEFVIILEDVEGRGEVEEVARRIIEALTEPVVLEQGNAKTGTSIGLVISSGVPRAGIRTVENLIRDADSAMYAAKEAGRARYAWFSPEMRERPRERPTFVQAINRLLNR
jgi:diguanylate cyclase (GGDEF)-like protein